VLIHEIAHAVSCEAMMSGEIDRREAERRAEAVEAACAWDGDPPKKVEQYKY
jgi:hypothetical protein